MLLSNGCSLEVQKELTFIYILNYNSLILKYIVFYTSDFSTEAPGGKFPPGLSSPLEKFPLNAIRLWHSSKPRRLTIPPTTTNLT